MDAPKKGSRWLKKMPVTGEPNRFQPTDVQRTVRVMSDPIEGYVMVRHSGCVPFLVRLAEWNDKYEPKPK